MTVFTLVILISGMVILARSALFWLYFIQVKHYRLDRLWLEIRARAFWRLIFSSHRIILLALVAGWFILFTIRAHYSLGVGWIIINGTYMLLYSAQTLQLIIRKQLKTPQYTIKVVALLTIVLLFEFLIALFYIGNTFFILALETLQPLIVLGIFAFAYIPNIFLHRYFITRANKKITAHKNLIVVGITGSYGKTTTKEFLAHILRNKFKVLKTPAHINVDTGVAKVILRDLKPEHEIFIVEMGAYKKGEIKKICDLVSPQYAIMTGLSDQHLELFGSLQAIADAKFELLEAVRDQAHIVANADSESLVSEFKRRHLMPRWYGIMTPATRFKPTEIVYSGKGTSFTLHGVQFQIPTIGTAALNNLLGAITMAVELGLHLKDIAQMVRDLAPVPHTMELKSTPSGALIIDDTYNANTEGVIAALHDLKYFNRSKRICVFSEVIELGERTNEDHTKIAKTVAHTTDYVLLLPSRMRELICNTLVKERYDRAHILEIKDIEQLKQVVDKDTVVLCEGREAQKIFSLVSPP